jgi:hypothetical protein
MDSVIPLPTREEGTEPAQAVEPVAGSFFHAGAVAESLFPEATRLGRAVSNDQLQAAWVHVLAAYDWQWFVTCTFREAVHPERADKAFRYWVKLIDAARLGPNYRSPSREPLRTRWVRALEWQKRDVLHYHALIGNLGEYDSAEACRRVWADEWDRIGGFAHIDTIGLVRGVCGYVAKYVSKGGQIDLSPTLRPAAASIWSS